MTVTSVPMMFKLDDQADVSELVAVMSLGLCTAIEAGSVTIAEAERRLFNPQILAGLEGLGLVEELLEIVHLGTELEDVQSLIPERLAESLAEIRSKALAFLSGKADCAGQAA
jgi:hypothetical protein